MVKSWIRSFLKLFCSGILLKIELSHFEQIIPRCDDGREGASCPRAEGHTFTAGGAALGFGIVAAVAVVTAVAMGLYWYHRRPLILVNKPFEYVQLRMSKYLSFVVV